MSFEVSVLVPLPFSKAFDYRVPDGMSVEVGQYVIVPFGKKTLKGVVWGKATGEVARSKIKDIIEVIAFPPMSDTLMRYIEWVADYTMSPLGSVLALSLSVPQALDPPKAVKGYILGPVESVKLTKARQKVIEYLHHQTQPVVPAIIRKETGVSAAVITPLIEQGALLPVVIEDQAKQDLSQEVRTNLSSVQQEVADQLVQMQKEHVFKTVLLEGVTGSGKTEVYLEAVREALMEGKQVLVMLPEIVLTTQMVARFEKRFGFVPTQWHSGLTPKQRREHFRAIATGKARLIIGARSALFLPFLELGLIVVDESHEQAYKQEEGVVYHARDMSVVRASKESIMVILATATPSIETIANVQQGKYTRLHLPSRHKEALLPEVDIIDMRTHAPKGQKWISEPLRNALEETMAKGEQSLLYLNRRGYAPLTLCRHCGHRFQCSHCSTWLVHHKYRDELHCHHCGHHVVIPKACPECGEEETLAACGPGVERLEEEVRTLAPDAHILLMTSDTITSPTQASAMIKQILDGHIDIIIGTQLVAKGHHFPNLTLVGVIDADIGLEGGDLRASERSYQLLHQVAGRAGREELPGRVMVQSFVPEHPVMKALCSHDHESFANTEMTMRDMGRLPPFYRLAAIIVSGKEEQLVKQTIMSLVQKAPHVEGMDILGPAPAPIHFLRNQYRYRLLVRVPRALHLQKILHRWIDGFNIPVALKVKIDVDPYSFL